MQIVPCEAYFNIEELPLHTWSTAKQFEYSIHLLHLNVLIYDFDSYLVSAYTTPIFVKFRSQVS